MGKYAYKNSRKKDNRFSIIGYVLFGIIALWLLASIYLELSPIEIIKKGVSTVGSSKETVESLKIKILEKDSIINALESQLKGRNQAVKKAIVKVSGNTLNLRSEPSLVSEVILHIPSESQVDILFYDTETYYLDGKAGKWCKISYTGQEGWVWGNFLLEL